MEYNRLMRIMSSLRSEIFFSLYESYVLFREIRFTCIYILRFFFLSDEGNSNLSYLLKSAKLFDALGSCYYALPFRTNGRKT